MRGTRTAARVARLLVVVGLVGAALVSSSSAASAQAAPDGEVSIDEIEVEVGSVANDDASGATTQDAPPWHLDRIDQPALPLDGEYRYPPHGGGGVRVYVVSTGVATTTNDLAGRVTATTDFTGEGQPEDCNGFGTSVAGVVGGTTYGVAKDVDITSTKVLDCGGSGSFDEVVQGIASITAEHTSGPAVAVLAFSGGGSDLVDDAVEALVADGVTVVAMGIHSASDVCGFSPARVPEAITVMAAHADGTQFPSGASGTCADLFAPGMQVPTIDIGAPDATRTLSSSAVAAGQVAGAAALVLADDPTATPAEVTATLLDRAAHGQVTGLGTGMPDRLLQVASGPFEDVGLNHPFLEEIRWMAEAGIATGWQPGPVFRPASPVSRQAMSAFLHRLAGAPEVDLPSSPTFADVAPSNPFYAEVEWMAAEGISTGTAGSPKPAYKPNDAVSRQAMSAFLYALDQGPGVGV